MTKTILQMNFECACGIINNGSMSRLQHPSTNVNQYLHEYPTIHSEKIRKGKGKKLNKRRNAIRCRPIIRISNNPCFREGHMIHMQKKNSSFNYNFK